MYQRGIEQGNPDIGAAMDSGADPRDLLPAALAVLLVVGVLILALAERRFVGRED